MRILRPKDTLTRPNSGKEILRLGNKEEELDVLMFINAC